MQDIFLKPIIKENTWQIRYPSTTFMQIKAFSKEANRFDLYIKSILLVIYINTQHLSTFL